MKRVVSVSLGSSQRDHKVVADIKGEAFQIERIGTDGDMARAISLIKDLDGKVDAFGLGGIDLYINGGNKKYIIKDARTIADAASISPVLDGSFLKNTLERKVIKYISDKRIINFKGKKVLLVCGVDRFGMADALIQQGGELTLGDAIFALGWNFPMHSLKILQIVAGILAPIACRMPFEMIYPTGSSQHEKNYKFIKYFVENEIIAGDFLYIKRYMPDKMDGKVVITNTVTQRDIWELKSAGTRMLITTTPELDGRSFGTNVMEAVLTVIAGKRPQDMNDEDYSELIENLGMVPRIEYLNDCSEAAID